MLAHDAIAGIPLASTADDGENASSAPYEDELQSPSVEGVIVLEIEGLDLVNLGVVDA